MNRRNVTDPTLVPKEKTRIRRIIDRVWAPYFSPAEAKVVAFIFTTTIEWSQRQDRLKVDHFINGLGHARGIGLSDKTVREALNTLERDGAISRKRTPYGYVIALMLSWDPSATRLPRTRATVSRKAAAPILEAPVNAAESGQEIGNSLRSRSVKGSDAYKREDTEERIPSYRPPDSCGLPEIRKNRPGREKKEPYLDPLDLVNLRATWTAAIAEAFPDITASAWGRREEAQACQFVNVDDKAKRANALEVFAWSIRSWRTIVAARFAWMDKSPPSAFPDIGFMLRWRDRFYDAWNDRERLRAEITMTGKDRRVRKLMHAGLTQEEATRDAEARDVLALERAKLAAERAQVSNMLRTIEERSKIPIEQRLAARHTYTQRGAPVRPNTATSAAFDCLPAIGSDL